MSEEKETVRSRETSEAHKDSCSSPAPVVSVRTLQDVQRDCEKLKVLHDESVGEYEAAVSAYVAARDAWNKEPNSEVLSKKLTEAKASVEILKGLMDSRAKRLEKLEAELAQLQAAANRAFEQKSKFLFCAAQYCISLQYCNLGVRNFMMFR